mmetsp:Transcript_14556/g.60740  ORF Transcript_14556/g.60740 Transcript_14556/m.60740 type:complete len:590 (+) Transcript_14556:2824-4593(+)
MQQPPSCRTAVQLLEGVHNTATSVYGLVAHACNQLSVAHDDAPLVRVPPKSAAQLGSRLNIHGRAPPCAVCQHRGQQLLSCPEPPRLEESRLWYLKLLFLRFANLSPVIAIVCRRRAATSVVQQHLEALGVQDGVTACEGDRHDDVVLDEAADGPARRRNDVLLVGIDNLRRLGTRELVLRQVQVDLVAVEVGVVGRAVGVVHANGALPSQHACTVRHQRGSMQGRLPIHKHHVAVAQMAMHHLGERRRDTSTSPLLRDREQCLGEVRAALATEAREVDRVALGVLNDRCTRVVARTIDDSSAQVLCVMRADPLWVREALRDVHGHADLVGRNQGIGRNDRARGKVDALAHHVFAEEALLLLEHLPHARALRAVAVQHGAHCDLQLLPAPNPHLIGWFRAPLGALSAILVVVRILSAAFILAGQRAPDVAHAQAGLQAGLQGRVHGVLEHEIAHLRRRAEAVRRNEQRLHEVRVRAASRGPADPATAAAPHVPRRAVVVAPHLGHMVPHHVGGEELRAAVGDHLRRLGRLRLGGCSLLGVLLVRVRPDLDEHIHVRVRAVGVRVWGLGAVGRFAHGLGGLSGGGGVALR